MGTTTEKPTEAPYTKATTTEKPTAPYKPYDPKKSEFLRCCQEDPKKPDYRAPRPDAIALMAENLKKLNLKAEDLPEGFPAFNPDFKPEDLPFELKDKKPVPDVETIVYVAEFADPSDKTTRSD